MGENNYRELDVEKLKMMLEDQEAMEVFLKMNNGVRSRVDPEESIDTLQDLHFEKEKKLLYEENKKEKYISLMSGVGIFHQMRQSNAIKYEGPNTERLKGTVGILYNLKTKSESYNAQDQLTKCIGRIKIKKIKEETLIDLIPQLNHNLVEDILNIELERNNKSKNK